MEQGEKYQVCVVGGGTAGITAAVDVERLRAALRAAGAILEVGTAE